MKNITIKIILSAFIFLLWSDVLRAQIPPSAANADPAVTGIVLVPASTTINGTATMKVLITNATTMPATGNIPAGSLYITIGFPAQYGIAASQLPLSIPGYTVDFVQTGPSGALFLINNAAIAPGANLDAVFTVTAFSTGSGTTTANVDFTTPLTVGNQSPANDNTFASFNVLSILPLKLTSFTATEKNCAAMLTWVTAQEENTAYFDVEQSADGSSFKAAGRTTAQGFGAGRTYNYTVSQSDGVSYYRLKMADADGSYRYSAIVPVRTNCAGKDNYFSVYPNPLTNTNTELTLSFKLSYKGKAAVWLTDNLGQRIWSKSIVVTEGGNAVKLQTGALMAGSYYLALTDESGKRLGNVQKIIKE